MNFYDCKNKIINEISNTLDKVSQEKLTELIEEILDSNKVFVDGVGRSGLIMKCFTMRLMHLGLKAFFVGETITPSATKNDILIIGSGSGETGSLLIKAQKAKEIGCKTALLTASNNSSISKLADYIINIPAPTPKAKTIYSSIQPMGSLFEQSLFLTTEIMIIKIMNMLKITSDNMFKKHANFGYKFSLKIDDILLSQIRCIKSISKNKTFLKGLSDRIEDKVMLISNYILLFYINCNYNILLFYRNY